MQTVLLRSAQLWFIASSLILALVPSGQAIALTEDCIGFNPDRIAVKQIQGRWKLVEGGNWILDFAGKRHEADQSFAIVKSYGFDHICFVGRPNPSMTYFARKKAATTVILVRHAEKVDDSADSPLTNMGECRAETLSRILNTPFFRRESPVSVVFSTNFTRTRETVNNYANSHSPSIPIQNYATPQEVADRIRTEHAGKTVLVAGHSGSVEQIVQNLGAGSVPNIGNEFNNLFVLTISPGGTAVLTHLKYEVWNAVLSSMNCQ